MRNGVLLTGLLLVATLAACAVVPGANADLDRQRQQAHDALDRWADAVAAAGGQQLFSVTDSRSGQIGNWELAVGDNNKLAFVTGLVEAAADLPSGSPVTGEVQWEDGSSLHVALISAEEALNEIRADGVSCQDCAELTPLRATGAVLSTATYSTSRGSATVPVWEFALEGTAVRITRVAVAPTQTVTVSPPPWDSYDPPVGLSIDAAAVSASGLELTVSFTGSPDPASKPCGADYSAEAVESSLAVVVIVIEHRHRTFGACADVGATRTAFVELAAPLTDRAVLEVKQGLPVPVTRGDGAEGESAPPVG